MKTPLFIIFALIHLHSFSQHSRISEKNSLAWFTTIITPQISKKISLHGEYQWRRVNFVKHWQQSLLRAGVTYKFSPAVSSQVGYAWAQTFPYGTYPLSSIPKMFPEHRIYEQIVINSPLGKNTLTNRIRLEQRWIGRFPSHEAEKPAFVYMNRFRYMPRLDIPIDAKWYASVYDEIFIGFGKNVGENVFDQNRIAALAGYKASKVFRIEGGFLNQTTQLGREIEGKNVFQYNSGMVINTYFNF
jgi:hypothetical protein